MNICVVIPTFNRLAYLRTLLEQLFSQKNNGKFKITVLVVIDGSTDNAYEMIVTEFPEVHVVQGTGNWWWTKSINEGIKVALPSLNPDQILILNDDSLIGRDYLSSLVDAFESAGEKCIIGSISVTDKEPFRVSFSGVKKINWFFLKKEHYYKSFELLENIPSSGLVPTYALNGRGTLIKTSILVKLNFLNERTYPQYGSDDDLALRAWEKGYKVLLSYSCRIYDRTGDTSKGTAFRQDSTWVFLKSFFTWNSANYIPKQLSFYYDHGIKIFLPFYLLKFILGSCYAYFFKYRKLKYEL